MNLHDPIFQDLLAKDSLQPHFRYRSFTKPKKHGGVRELVEPDEHLKQLQQSIIRTYFNDMYAHSAAKAYRPRLSIADHVWPHSGAVRIITVDVQNFFPTTRAWRIEQWWRQRVDEVEARLLTLLTTWKGGLPQGAPTSPGLSNFVNFEMDTKLTMHADLAGANYTRYCDDMVFSWPTDGLVPSDFEENIRATLQESGYSLHPTKGWLEYHRKDEPEITGLILTKHGHVRLPNSLQKKINKLKRSRDPRQLQRLEGYQSYQAMVTKRGK